MVLPLITSPDQNFIYKCDFLNKDYQKMRVDGIDFRDHTSVQVKTELYAISFADLQITRIENLLNKIKAV